MSKKRKTRKQKETAALRHNTFQERKVETPIYSINGIAIQEKEVTKAFIKESSSQKDNAYLRHDITLITAASGIIVAFDFLLFILLTRGVIHLSVFGY